MPDYKKLLPVRYTSVFERHCTSIVLHCIYIVLVLKMNLTFFSKEMSYTVWL